MAKGIQFEERKLIKREHYYALMMISVEFIVNVYDKF